MIAELLAMVRREYDQGVVVGTGGTQVIEHTQTDASGCYTFELQGYSGTWILEALYDGVGMWGSAKSLPLKVKVP